MFNSLAGILVSLEKYYVLNGFMYRRCKIILLKSNGYECYDLQNCARGNNKIDVFSKKML